VPGAAAGLAEIGTRDHDPLEALRRRQHLSQQLAVGALDVAAARQLRPRVRPPRRQFVPNPLQLAEVEQPALAMAGERPPAQLGPAEGFAEEAGELTLQARDLAAQLGAGEALVDRRAERALEVALLEVSFEHVRHRLGFECRSRKFGGKGGLIKTGRGLAWRGWMARSGRGSVARFLFHEMRG
jgi:hypothetical protein